MRGPEPMITGRWSWIPGSPLRGAPERLNVGAWLLGRNGGGEPRQERLRAVRRLARHQRNLGRKRRRIGGPSQHPVLLAPCDPPPPPHPRPQIRNPPRQLD